MDLPGSLLATPSRDIKSVPVNQGIRRPLQVSGARIGQKAPWSLKGSLARPVTGAWPRCSSRLRDVLLSINRSKLWAASFFGRPWTVAPAAVTSIRRGCQASTLKMVGLTQTGLHGPRFVDRIGHRSGHQWFSMFPFRPRRLSLN